MVCCTRNTHFPTKLSHLHDFQAWLGTEWDPNEVLEESNIAELVRQENRKKNDREALVVDDDDDDGDDGENIETAEEGFAFINREE